MNQHNDDLEIRARPTGIVTAIAASQRGLLTTVMYSRLPPIDKPSGEGLLPPGATALRDLGIHLYCEMAFPLSGIRFSDEGSSVCSQFVGTLGFSLRRVKLHELLVEFAVRAGVNFQWGARVEEIHSRYCHRKQKAYSLYLAGWRRWAEFHGKKMGGVFFAGRYRETIWFPQTPADSPMDRRRRSLLGRGMSDGRDTQRRGGNLRRRDFW